MIYLFTNEFMHIHYFYNDEYIYVHNGQYSIYKKWRWKNLHTGTIDIPEFDITSILPEKLNFVNVGNGDDNFIDMLSKYIEIKIFENI